MPKINSPCKECKERQLNEKGGKVCGAHNCSAFKDYTERAREQEEIRAKQLRVSFGVRKVQYNGLSQYRRKK